MQEAKFWLAWAQIEGVGPVILRRLRHRFGNLETAWGASAAELAQVEGLGDRKVEGILQGRSRLDPDRFWQEHGEKNSQFWTPADDRYPRLLRELPGPPPVLYYRGQVEMAENRGTVPAVGIVGTRSPSDYGKKWTHRIATALAKRGFCVVSGMAAGIDAVAHHGSLQAGGRTIAVLGTGVDRIYPPQNRDLYAQLVDRGLVLSEYPAGTPPDRDRFPQRNRIIAGLSRAVLVTEAPKKSGALITARHANKFNRDVYALCGSLDNKNAIGCIDLIANGARVFTDERHFIEQLCALPEVNLTAPEQLSLGIEAAPPMPKLEPPLDRVFEVISAESIAFDAVVERSNLDTGTVSAALTHLEMLGLVVLLPGMRYCRA